MLRPNATLLDSSKNKELMMRICKFLIGTLLSISMSAAIAGTPQYIYVVNNTDLSLSSSIAGLPGNGIKPGETRAVPYGIINLGCSHGMVMNNCPITFTDNSNGQTVAVVKLNALQAVLVEAPTFYGQYASKYLVTGWEGTLSNITIDYKM
jgi:hypothetical protein